MKVYVLKARRPNLAPFNEYDTMQGIVVLATWSGHARKIAAKHCGDEGPDVWLNTDFTSSWCVGHWSKMKEGVVLREFKAG
jgi:hypothetical protein